MAVHGVQVAVISGQKNSGDIVLAADVFLHGAYSATSPVSINKNIRQDLFLSLYILRQRGCIQLRDTSFYYTEKLVDKIMYPGEYVSWAETFWLALDEQGYSIAKEIFAQKGLIPDEQVYPSVLKLNLLEPTIPNYPEIVVPPEFWTEIRAKITDISWQHRRVQSQKGRRALFDRLLPMTSVEKELCSWYALLDNSLKPWVETIENMINAWS